MEKEWCGKFQSRDIDCTTLWNVEPQSLELVPLDFPLERTHREICDADSLTVAGRISEVLKKLSIDAEYCDQSAKARCKTQDFVCFRIRLYAGGDKGQPIIVEVQRRNGPVRSFMHTCRRILEAAEGKDYQAESIPGGPKPMGNIATMKCLQGLSIKFDPREECFSSLRKIYDMMHDERVDINVLGMENLCCLTDPTKTAFKTAELAAKAVVIGVDSFCLRDEIYLVFQRAADHVMDCDLKGVDHSDSLRLLALKAFALSLKLTEEVKCLDGHVKEERWFQDVLIPLLLVEVENAKLSPSRACLSICCLNSLCATCMKTVVIDLNGESSIRAAQEVGNQRHELLANEASRCLLILELQDSQ